jgi:hypothetical protein
MKVFRNEQVHLRQTSLFSNNKVQSNGSVVPRFVTDGNKASPTEFFHSQMHIFGLCSTILKVPKEIGKFIGKQLILRARPPCRGISIGRKKKLDTEQKFL